MILRLAYQENDPENNPYWNDMRNHDYSKSFPAVSNFIHQNSTKTRSPKRRNRITWVVAVVLPLLIFFSCKQKTYTQPQGATLGFTAKDSVQSTVELAIQQFAESRPEEGWKALLIHLLKMPSLNCREVGDSLEWETSGGEHGEAAISGLPARLSRARKPAPP